MISYLDWQSLKAWKPEGEGLVLSLYLDVDQSKDVNRNRGFERTLHNMARSQDTSSMSPAILQEWQKNQEAVEKFMDLYQPTQRALVAFSDVKRSLWWHRELTVPVINELCFSDSPYLPPLVGLMDEYDRYGVVLLDKEHARFFGVYMGDIEELASVSHEIPRNTQTVGRDQLWSQKNQQRHHRERVFQHFKEVGEKWRELGEEHRFDFLAVGGSQQATSELLHALAPSLARRLAGTFPLPVHAKAQEVLHHILEIEGKQRQARDRELVETLVTTTNKGGKATLGLADTVDAINEGRVWRLVFDRGFAPSGYICGQCGLLLVEDNHDRCRRCGTATELSSNLINKVIEKVMDAGGTIEEVSDDAASKLSGLGHIGALLRY